MTRKHCKKLLMAEGFSPRKADDILKKVNLYGSYQDLYAFQMAPIVISRIPDQIKSALMEAGEVLSRVLKASPPSNLNVSKDEMETAMKIMRS